MKLSAIAMQKRQLEISSKRNIQIAKKPSLNIFFIKMMTPLYLARSY
jgi:hypothetical protein